MLKFSWRQIAVLTFSLFFFTTSHSLAEKLPPAEDNKIEKPNVIFIFCDNLGYGDIEPFGSKVHRTPHLNRMAREGRKFTHFCVTSGVCTPSRSSLMTGCYSQRVGMHTNPHDGWVLRPVSPYGLNPREITIAEVLKKQGYRTACIGKWHLGDQPQFLPTSQGFDMFYGIPYSDDMTQRTKKQLANRPQWKIWPPLPLMENDKVIEAPTDRDLLTKKTTERALQFIEKNKENPFFLYFPQTMPGSTKTPFASKAFKGKSKNGPWGDSIEEIDWSTGQILDKLVELNIDRRTLVVWTSDNGAPINRDLTDVSRGTNLPLHGRGYTTAEGAFRVPTIFWWQGKIKAGTICKELATTMDILPTVALLAGTKPPQDRIIDGHDIRPLMFNKPEAKTPYKKFYYYQEQQLQAVRSGPWKLFLPLKQFKHHPHFIKPKKGKPGNSDQLLLFNVETDIASKQNVAKDHPKIVMQLLHYAEEAKQDLGDNNQTGKNQRSRGKVHSPKPLQR